MRIKKNSLLPPTSNEITFNNNCLIAREGPNISGKLSLSSMLVKYDSFFSSTMILQPKDKYKPIMYGFLGTNVTFVAIIPDYNINPQMCPGDNFIEYYYEDQPLVTRIFTDILILSGNEAHRIPQLYVYNPSDNVVTLNIMVANVDNNEISTILNPEFEVISGLAYNSIISNKIENPTCTGSTQFEILDLTDNIQMIIDYSTIDIMEIKDNVITITTTSDTPIKLEFLNNFNANQAFSRMNWVYESQAFRFLTKTYPHIDITPPLITWNTTYGDNEINPLRINIGGSTQYPITKNFLINQFIDKVEDYDGNNSPVEFISKYDGIVIIQDINNGLMIDEIVKDGRYNVTFTYQDIATNKVNKTRYVVIDSLGPEIRFTPNVSDIYPNITMNLADTTQTPNTICYNDLLRHTVDSVWDDVDGYIDKTDQEYFSIHVLSGGTPINTPSGITCVDGITQKGDYDLIYTAKDTGNNWTIITGNTLKVIDDRPIVIFNNNANGSTITMSGLLQYTYTDIRNYSLASVTSVYGTNIDYNKIELFMPNDLSGTSYIATSGETGYNISDIHSNGGFITQYVVTSGVTSNIIEPFLRSDTIINDLGEYEVIFIVVDSEGHSITHTKKLIIV